MKTLKKWIASFLTIALTFSCLYTMVPAIPSKAVALSRNTLPVSVIQNKTQMASEKTTIDMPAGTTDIYSFTISSPGYVRITINGTSSTENGTLVKYILHDGYLSEYASGSIAGTKAKIEEHMLEAGSYNLVLSRDTSGIKSWDEREQAVDISVDTIPADRSKAEMNSFSTAATADLNGCTYGFLSKEEKTQFFKIYIKKPTVISKIRITHFNTAKNELPKTASLLFTMYDGKRVQQFTETTSSATDYGAMTTITKLKNTVLNPGTYYFSLGSQSMSCMGRCVIEIKSSPVLYVAAPSKVKVRDGSRVIKGRAPRRYKVYILASGKTYSRIAKNGKFKCTTVSKLKKGQKIKVWCTYMGVKSKVKKIKVK